MSEAPVLSFTKRIRSQVVPPSLVRKIPRSGRAYPGDYDHLARIAEWSLDADGDGGEEG